MEKLQDAITHGINFWYLAGMVQLKNSFWNTTLGRFVMALMPALITATLTSAVTVFSIYMSMRDDVMMLKSMVYQVKHEYQMLSTEQQVQSIRLREAEQALARLNGAIDASRNGVNQETAPRLSRKK